MIRLAMTLLAAALLSGCEAVNETLVRQLFLDRGLSSEISSQIREGFERRLVTPPVRAPQRSVPAFFDQG